MKSYQKISSEFSFTQKIDAQRNSLTAVNSRKTWDKTSEQSNGRRIHTEMSNSSTNQDIDQENSRSKNLFIEESANESSRASSSSRKNQMQIPNQDMFTNNFTKSSRNKSNPKGRFSKTNGHMESKFDDQIKKLQEQSQKQLEEMDKNWSAQKRDKLIKKDNVTQALKKKYT